MIGAMVVPEETLCMVRDVFRSIAPVIDLVSKNIASDLGSGSNMLLAAAESAFLNVKINAKDVEDRAWVADLIARGEAIQNETIAKEKAILAIVEAKL